jgi:hypothetical protein
MMMMKMMIHPRKQIANDGNRHRLENVENGDDSKTDIKINLPYLSSANISSLCYLSLIAIYKSFTFNAFLLPSLLVNF